MKPCLSLQSNSLSELQVDQPHHSLVETMATLLGDLERDHERMVA